MSKRKPFITPTIPPIVSSGKRVPSPLTVAQVNKLVKQGKLAPLDEGLASLAEQFAPQHGNVPIVLVTSPDSNGFYDRPAPAGTDWTKQGRLPIGKPNDQGPPAHMARRGVSVAGAGVSQRDKRS